MRVGAKDKKVYMAFARMMNEIFQSKNANGIDRKSKGQRETEPMLKEKKREKKGAERDRGP